MRLERYIGSSFYFVVFEKGNHVLKIANDCEGVENEIISFGHFEICLEKLNEIESSYYDSFYL
jgi:uncharacterized membrane protein